MCLEGFGAHVITHLEVRSDKAMPFEVLKITSHEEVEKKCGLQGGGRGREGERGKKGGGRGMRRRFLTTCQDKQMAPTPTSVLVESILELQHWRT